MDISRLAGVRLHFCRYRENYAQYYYNSKHEKGSNSLLFLITRGQALFEFKQAGFRAGPGDIICWDPDTLKESYPMDGKGLSFYHIGFELLSDSGKRLFCADAGLPFRIRVKKPGRIVKVFKEITRASDSGKAVRLPAGAEAVLRLFQIIKADRIIKEKTENYEGRRMHFRIRDTLNYIRRHYKKKMDVAQLAKRAAMHPSYFTHLFKAEIGVSPHRYILDYKIEKAKDFLCTFDEALEYTAEELGFHDYAHFYRTFKKTVGQTPREFVKANKDVYDPR